eukprot:2308973-Prymnesium_polylepis.1
MARNADKCPARPSMGIPAATAIAPASFMAWVDDASQGSQRETPAASKNEGPLNYAGLARAPYDSLAEGVRGERTYKPAGFGLVG